MTKKLTKVVDNIYCDGCGESCTTTEPVVEHEYGRPAYSFPIKYSLPYPNSGFWEFRQKSGDSYGRAEDFIYQLLQNHDIIYIEKNG